ncbi:hypothetical protein BH20ACT23_BH20ACT23_04730 [soil metagenome]
MARTRISTTVDAHRLAEARKRLAISDSELIDRALAALIDDLETDRERTALAERPYEDDPELAWQVPVGPDLPYDHDIPRDVLELAAERRRRTRDE